ncbi:MAG: TIGR04086 family membrane protein [Clostridia bacterium]|nr:TIGR04086 family membrane protein [Clostridia bacterium]
MSDDKKLNIRGILKGVLIALAITVVFVIIIALICYFADISDGVIAIMLYVVGAVSVFTSSLFLAKSITTKGMLHGLILGLGYFMVIFILSAVFKKQVTANTKLFVSLISALASGMLGGIMGVNTND